MRCPTPGCNRRLTPYERAQGRVTCALCRPRSTFNAAAPAGHRRTEPPPATVSWWLNATRDHFSDLARARTVKTHD